MWKAPHKFDRRAFQSVCMCGESSFLSLIFLRLMGLGLKYRETQHIKHTVNTLTLTLARIRPADRQRQRESKWKTHTLRTNRGWRNQKRFQPTKNKKKTFCWCVFNVSHFVLCVTSSYRTFFSCLSVGLLVGQSVVYIYVRQRKQLPLMVRRIFIK